MVYADQPICKKCGLEMSSEGVADLAKMEEGSIKSLDEIYKLRQISTISLIITIAGFLITLALGFNFFFHLYFWMAIANIFLGFVGWNNKYATLNFAFEDIEMIKKKKKKFCFSFL